MGRPFSSISHAAVDFFQVEISDFVDVDGLRKDAGLDPPVHGAVDYAVTLADKSDGDFLARYFRGRHCNTS
jgi:hypothetical protein